MGAEDLVRAAVGSRVVAVSCKHHRGRQGLEPAMVVPQRRICHREVARTGTYRQIFRARRYQHLKFFGTSPALSTTLPFSTRCLLKPPEIRALGMLGRHARARQPAQATAPLRPAQEGQVRPRPRKEYPYLKNWVPMTSQRQGRVLALVNQESGTGRESGRKGSGEESQQVCRSQFSLETLVVPLMMWYVLTRRLEANSSSLTAVY